jgi:hypothetical protein
MSSTNVVSRNQGESYTDFAVRAHEFLEALPTILGDMHEADRLILTDTGLVDGGRSVTLVIVKNSLDTEGQPG